MKKFEKPIKKGTLVKIRGFEEWFTKVFTCLKDSERARYRDMVREIHEADFLPDDFRYETIHTILGLMADHDEGELNEVKTKEAFLELFEGSKHELIDRLIPVYNSERTDWLASHNYRADYIETARKEGILSSDADIYQQIACGIYLEIEEIFNNALDVVGGEIENMHADA